MVRVVDVVGVLSRDIVDIKSQLFADVESHGFLSRRTSASFKGYSPRVLCWDNSVAQSLFSMLKNERVYRTV